MSVTKQDYTFYQGWQAGSLSLIDDIRQELLTLEADTGGKLPLEVYEILNDKKRQVEGMAGNGKAVNLPPCENEEDLVFNNID